MAAARLCTFSTALAASFFFGGFLCAQSHRDVLKTRLRLTAGTQEDEDLSTLDLVSDSNLRNQLVETNAVVPHMLSKQKIAGQGKKAKDEERITQLPNGIQLLNGASLHSADVAEDAHDGDGAYNSGKRVLGGYGMRTQKAMLLWWERSKPWGSGSQEPKVVFCFMCVLIFIGPCSLYSLLYGWLLLSTEASRISSPVLDKIVHTISLPLKVMSLFGCLYIVGALLRQGAGSDYPLLDDIILVITWILTCAFFAIPLRVLAKVDRHLHALARDRVTNKAYLKRREMMTAITQGSHIVAPSKANEELGYFLYNYIWRPFHLFTIAVIVLMIVIEACGDTSQSFIIVAGYSMVTFAMAVFGARTLGPELYGGLILFFERPFIEGDIITVDKMGSQGGAATDVVGSVVTGFVERIGVRSVTVRRFDMRAVWVPNSYFMTYAVANWNTRPRKLIYLQFAASHRTPVELCRLMQEKVLYAVKNNSGVDQQMYIKAVFRKLDSGLNFLLVCFNARGTKKQNVQQDLLFTIVGLARKLEIELVFEQQNMYVEREDVPEGHLYLGADEPTPLQDRIRKDAKCLDADLGALLPMKKEITSTPKQQFSPDGMIVVRLEEMTLFQIQSGSFLTCSCRHAISGFFATGDEAVCKKCGKEILTNDKKSREDEKKNKTRAYKIKLRVVPDGMEDASSVPWSKHLQSDVSSRVALLADKGDKAVDELHEVRFFENLAFPIVDIDSSPAPLSPGVSDGPAPGSIPRRMEFHAMQVSKGFKNWTWNCPQARIGVATTDVHKLVKKARATNKAQPLDLLDDASRVVGNLMVQVLVPEKHNDDLMGDLSD